MIPFFSPQCINNAMRRQNISNSLHLPDKTLQFVKDHPLLEDPVQPIGNGPRLITKDVNYTQIAVERVRALDGRIYDVMFTGTGEDRGGCWGLNAIVFKVQTQGMIDIFSGGQHK